jgi:hypothetical protein
MVISPIPFKLIHQQLLCFGTFFTFHEQQSINHRLFWALSPLFIGRKSIQLNLFIQKVAPFTQDTASFR